MSKAKPPSLAPEIASAPVADEDRQRWAWFLPRLLELSDDLLLDRYGVERPNGDEVEEAHEDAETKGRALTAYAEELEAARVKGVARLAVNRDAGKLTFHQIRNEEARLGELDAEAKKHRAEASRLATRRAAWRTRKNRTREAAERELFYLYEIVVPRADDHDARAAAILDDCTGEPRVVVKAGIRVTLLLADLARKQLPIPDRVIEALAAALGLSKRDREKPERSRVTWVDSNTPLRVLGSLAGRKASNHDVARALFDCVLWNRQHNLVSSGPVLNALAALFGLIDPTTGDVNYDVLAKATNQPRLNSLLQVADHPDASRRRVQGVKRSTVARIAEAAPVVAAREKRHVQHLRSNLTRELLNDLSVQSDSFAAINGDPAAKARADAAWEKAEEACRAGESDATIAVAVEKAVTEWKEWRDGAPRASAEARARLRAKSGAAPPTTPPLPLPAHRGARILADPEFLALVCEEEEKLALPVAKQSKRIRRSQ